MRITQTETSDTASRPAPKIDSDSDACLDYRSACKTLLKEFLLERLRGNLQLLAFRWLSFCPRAAAIHVTLCLLIASAAQNGADQSARDVERRIKLGDLNGARQQCEEDLRLYPRSAELWNLLGIADSELGNAPSAQRAFEQGLQIAPNSLSLNENLGLLFFRQLDYAHAKKNLARAVQLGSGKPGVLFSLAASRLRTGEPAQALRDLNSLQPALSGVPDYWDERGRAELSASPMEAEQSFARALALSPHDIAALNGAATAAERQHLDEKALAYLIRCRSAAPDDIPTLVHFADVCIRRDLGPDAIAALEHAQRLDPANFSVLYLLARANISVENWQKAYDLFSQFSKRYPDFGPTYYALGWIDIRLNRTDDARRQLEHCLQLDPGLTAARYELAQLEYDDGKMETAKKLLATVLRQNPQHARANMTMGEIFMREGNFAASRKLLESAIRQDPKLAAAHYKLAVLLLREHKPQQADREKQVAAQLNQEANRASRTQLRLVLPEPK